jgi:hypothetical protein
MESKQRKFETAIRTIAANMMPLAALTCLRRQHTPTCGFQGLMPQADILLLVTECFGRREKSPPGRVGDRLYIARLRKVPKGAKLEKKGTRDVAPGRPTSVRYSAVSIDPRGPERTG